MRHGLLPAILAAVGYALLELEFFARRNLLLPWEPGHLVAGALFLLVHGVVAIGALLLSAVDDSFAKRFPPLCRWNLVRSWFHVNAHSTM